MYRFYFSNLIFDSTTRTLSNHGGESISLRPLPYEVLNLLLENQGVHVTRERLFEICWEGALVTDQALTNVISGLRKEFVLLGETDVTIKTASKIGYVLEVRCEKPTVKEKIENQKIEVKVFDKAVDESIQYNDKPLESKITRVFHILISLFLISGLLLTYLFKPFINKPDFMNSGQYQHFKIVQTDFYLHDDSHFISDKRLLEFELKSKNLPVCYADIYLRISESVYEDGTYILKAFAFAKYSNKNANYINHSIDVDELPEKIIEAIRQASSICG